MLGLVIKLACFDTCPKLSESKTVFNIFGPSMKHYLFNPIELIWGIPKNYDRHIGRDGYAENNVLDITPEMRKNSLLHIEDKIKEW
jgi:hypothetical protein